MNYLGGMNYYNNYSNVHYGLFGLIIPFMIIDLILKGYSLWKAAQKGQTYWFVALLIVNSMGILPIIYLVLNRENNTHTKKTSKKANKSR